MIIPSKDSVESEILLVSGQSHTRVRIVFLIR